MTSRYSNLIGQLWFSHTGAKNSFDFFQFCLGLSWCSKGQIIYKGIFDILEFSQKTNGRIRNGRIRFSSKNEFVSSFFGRIRGYQKVFPKLSDLYVVVFWSLISKKSSNRGALHKSVYCDLSFDGKEMRPLSPKRLTLTYILEGTDFNQKSQTFAGYWLWLKKTSFLDTLQIWKIGKIYWFQLSIYTTLCSQYFRHSINHNFSFL